MSSILKALRKVEDENAALGEGSVDLAHDILKRSYEGRKSTPWFLLVGVSLLFVSLVAMAGWWVWNSQQPTTAVDRAQIPPPVAELPAAKEQTVVQPLPGQIEMLAPPVLVPKPMVTPAKIEVSVTDNKQSASVAASAPIDIPDLRVEEIVYHPQPESRLAVINELPVMVGTDIDGVRVEEILPDRVRFSYQGILFNKFKTGK